MNHSDQSINLPINISLAIGAYTTKLWIGSEQVAVDVLIDTGSSTLAINLDKYDPNKDQTLKNTSYAQSVVYGLGGWAGPVIHSQVELDHSQRLLLHDAPIAITANGQAHNFQQADGIWGLAYHHLNKAYDVSSQLNQLKPPLDTTHPWPFAAQVTASSVAAFKKYLRQFPEHDITPLFSAFEQNNITPNQFALSTHRSIVYVPQADMSAEQVAAEPLNQGQFIIGAKVTEAPKLTTKVVHDAYYNTELLNCQVAGFAPCQAPPLQSEKLHSFFSNAIIDSGCSFVILQQILYNYVMDCLRQIDAEFPTCIEASQSAFKANQNYHNNALDLSQWPELKLTFAGVDDESVTLSIPPNCYWQQHARAPDNWMFMLMNQLPQWPDQTICGLPLFNNHTCVFDRSASDCGQIHWYSKSTA
jgi:hypothetical protein